MQKLLENRIKFRKFNSCLTSVIYTKDENEKLDIYSFSDEEEVKLGECAIKIDKIYRKIGFEQDTILEDEDTKN